MVVGAVEQIEAERLEVGRALGRAEQPAGAVLHLGPAAEFPEPEEIALEVDQRSVGFANDPGHLLKARVAGLIELGEPAGDDRGERGQRLQQVVVRALPQRCVVSEVRGSIGTVLVATPPAGLAEVDGRGR